MKLTPKTVIISIITAPFVLVIGADYTSRISQYLTNPKTFSTSSVSPSVTPTPIATPSVTPRKPVRSYADEYVPEYKAPLKYRTKTEWLAIAAVWQY